MYTLDNCRTVVRALRSGNRLKKYNDLLGMVGYSLHPTIHLADRLFDHSIDMKRFVDSFFVIMDSYLLTLVSEIIRKHGSPFGNGVKFSINDLVFVFEAGQIDSKNIILKTIYPLRPDKFVDLDAKKLAIFRKEVLASLQT